jgi:hypothetical protein
MQGPCGPHQVPGGAGGGGAGLCSACLRAAVGVPGCAAALSRLPRRQLLIRARCGRLAAARLGQRGERLSCQRGPHTTRFPRSAVELSSADYF